MADFYVAYKLTMDNEGGYVNDPDDSGKETYKGISRRYHPNWAGWRKVDHAKEQKDFSIVLGGYSDLESDVRVFYKEQFWNIFLGDEISDQSLANELFDTSVNMSPARSISFLQEALNILNRDEMLYFDIVVDGQFGNRTMIALISYFTNDNVSYLVKIMNILQGMYYLRRIRGSPKQEKFARGWLNRVEISKTKQGR